MNPRRLKQSFLYIARALGAFRLSRFATRHQLRILCYHGFSVGDEFIQLPQMFMRAETFGRRMALLDRLGLPVIPLDEAVDRLKTNRINNAEVVITLDDGWATNLSIAYPVLQAHRFPATIYITTEHLANSTEVFNVIIQYLFLKSQETTVHISGLHSAIDGTYSVKPDPFPAMRKLIHVAAQHLSLGERQACLGKIASALGLDIENVLKDDRFRLLTADEIAELSSGGVAIELHTHTHELPTETFEAMRSDITRNREAVEVITGKRAQHFCYPSGKYSASHPEWLAAMGIKSATTCDAGLNDSTANCLLLRRYLDQDNISDIEFEASISGFRHFLHRFLK